MKFSIINKSLIYSFIISQLQLTPLQQKFQNLIQDKNIPIVFGIGPAGTGKTMISCYEALTAVKNNKYKKIIITRPAVSVDEEIGFLPGTLNEKMTPWVSPLFDYFNDIHQANKLLNSGIIEIVPMSFIRGRTFNNAIIIGDEMQNSTPMQMKTFLTRIGQDSKMIITGDLEQSDLGYDNGLQNIINLINEKYTEQYKMYSDGIGITYFNKDNIKRNSVITNVLKLYE